ncbi:MAG TPA: hypothetical protein VME45_04835 [Stellaceae bacterium]|nr:hypothetical protein [Stellaceae bacterium]
MRSSKIIIALIAAGSLTGCSWSQKMEGRLAPDTLSLADRCGAIMQAAMPFARLELGDRTSRSPDVSTIVAQVAATRTDLPKDAAAGRDLLAECTFENNVMTAFEWTKGGPLPSPTAGTIEPLDSGPAAPAGPNPAPAGSAASVPKSGKAPASH